MAISSIISEELWTGVQAHWRDYHKIV